MSKLVAKIPTLAGQAVVAAKPKLRTFLKYAKVELIPPNPTELPEVIRGFGSLMRGFKRSSWKNLTVREAWLNTLIATEVVCWFFVGECIGKGKLVGYSV